MKKSAAQFHRYCRERYVPIGFRKNDGCYARVIHDVLQTFDFHFRGGGSPECVVEYGTRPLCMNLYYPYGGQYDLFQLDFETGIDGTGWNVVKDGVTDFTVVFDWMERRMLPFFLKTECCRDSLQTLLEIEKEAEDNRIRHLQMKGKTDCASHRFAISKEAMFVALKNGAYDIAESTLSAYCDLVQEDHWKTRKLTDAQSRFAQQIPALKRFVEEDDRSSIHALLSENEQLSLIRMKEFGLEPVNT